MNLGDDLSNLLIMQRAEPARLGRVIVSDPKANRVDHKYVGEPRDNCLAAGAHFLRFGTNHPQRTLHPIGLWRSPRVNSDGLRQEPDQLLRGGIIELKQAANHRRPLAVSAESKSFITLAHQLTMNFE